jgi:PKD repeat protein
VYTVTLTVGDTNSGQRDTETKVDYIEVTSTPPQDFPEFLKRIFDRFTGNVARDVDNLAIVTLLEMSKGISYDLSELGQVEQALSFISIGASGSIGEFAIDVRKAWADYQTDLGGAGAGTQDYLVLWTNMMRRFDGDIETQNETYIGTLFTCIREYIGFTGNEVTQVGNAVSYMNAYRRYLLDLEAALLQYQTDLGGGT